MSAPLVGSMSWPKGGLQPAFAHRRLRHVLYLHGFRSSPHSFKAQALQAHLAEHDPDLEWVCPQLPMGPDEAVALLEALTKDWPSDRAAVIGSSLGGFYADIMARRRGWASVVMNPAVHPARDLAAYVGTLSAWHDATRTFEFTSEHLHQLRQLQVERAQSRGESAPARTAPQLAILAKGDELLDWREMLAQHAMAQVCLLEGSDHALSDFVGAHLPYVLAFLGLEMPATLPHLPDLECPR